MIPKIDNMANFTKATNKDLVHIIEKKHIRLIHDEYVIKQDKGYKFQNNFTSRQHRHANKAKFHHFRNVNDLKI